MKNLPLVVWADRITTRASIGFAPYKLVFGQDCVLSIELRAASWAVIAWEMVRTLEDLLAARARQLERKEDDIRQAQDTIRRSRQKNKVQFDKTHRRRKEVLKVGDMVLLHNTVLGKQWSRKLDNHWMGPYLIRVARLDLGTYLLDELDGTELSGVYAGDRLKKFFQREKIELEDEEVDEEEDNEDITSEESVDED